MSWLDKIERQFYQSGPNNKKKVKKIQDRTDVNPYFQEFLRKLSELDVINDKYCDKYLNELNATLTTGLINQSEYDELITILNAKTNKQAVDDVDIKGETKMSKREIIAEVGNNSEEIEKDKVIDRIMQIVFSSHHKTIEEVEKIDYKSNLYDFIDNCGEVLGKLKKVEYLRGSLFSFNYDGDVIICKNLSFESVVEKGKTEQEEIHLVKEEKLNEICECDSSKNPFEEDEVINIEYNNLEELKESLLIEKYIKYLENQGQKIIDKAREILNKFKNIEGAGRIIKMEKLKDGENYVAIFYENLWICVNIYRSNNRDINIGLFKEGYDAFKYNYNARSYRTPYEFMKYNNLGKYFSCKLEELEHKLKGEIGRFLNPNTNAKTTSDNNEDSKKIQGQPVEENPRIDKTTIEDIEEIFTGEEIKGLEELIKAIKEKPIICNETLKKIMEGLKSYGSIKKIVRIREKKFYFAIFYDKFIICLNIYQKNKGIIINILKNDEKKWNDIMHRYINGAQPSIDGFLRNNGSINTQRFKFYNPDKLVNEVGEYLKATYPTTDENIVDDGAAEKPKVITGEEQHSDEKGTNVNQGILKENSIEILKKLLKEKQLLLIIVNNMEELKNAERQLEEIQPSDQDISLIMGDDMSDDVIKKIMQNIYENIEKVTKLKQQIEGINGIIGKTIERLKKLGYEYDGNNLEERIRIIGEEATKIYTEIFGNAPSGDEQEQ